MVQKVATSGLGIIISLSQMQTREEGISGKLESNSYFQLYNELF